MLGRGLFVLRNYSSNEYTYSNLTNWTGIECARRRGRGNYLYNSGFQTLLVHAALKRFIRASHEQNELQFGIM